MTLSRISESIRGSLVLAVAPLLVATLCSESAGQGFQIGGLNGVVIGGGEGLRIGGTDGVQFGGGQGAKFGGPSGVQFGGGQGAKFGGPDGVQFGGGASAKFGPLQIGGESGSSKTLASNQPLAPAHVAPPSEQDRPISLHYPADTLEPLHFTLNGWQYTLPPGETVYLQRDQIWVIEFPRGDHQRGSHRYSLPPGSYTFKQQAAGWNLFRDKAARLASAPSTR